MYTGKEVCQGCGKPGSEHSRSEKNKLCSVCKEFLRVGQLKTKEAEVKYQYVFQHHFAFSGDFLNTAIHTFLKSIHNPHASTAGVDYIKYSSGSNGKYYIIDQRFFLPLQELFLFLEKRLEEVLKKEEKIPGLVQAELRKQKNKIFNEGVQKGKQLLIGLNNGTLSLGDFDKTINEF